MLRSGAEEFAPLTEPVEPASLARLPDASESRIAEVLAALQEGRPPATAALIEEIAGELDQTPPLVYWTAVEEGLRQDSDLDRVLAAMDERLGAVRPEDLVLWDQTNQGRALSEAVAGRVLPLTGLDLEAALDFTQVYLDNFPLFSRPLGDVDQRAAGWIAQVLDVGATRATHRRILFRLTELAGPRHPRAADYLREWAVGPAPADPTQDAPWKSGLITLVRTKL